MGLHLENELVKTPTIISNNPVQLTGSMSHGLSVDVQLYPFIIFALDGAG